MVIFCEKNVDIALLEVGMGGRLDAVNLFDADIALITPIGLDHMAWLGDSIDKIAIEKAGVMRQGKPVVCSESNPPISLCQYAETLNASAYKAADAFRVEIGQDSWNWQNQHQRWENLPFPALKGNYQIQNASAVLQVISLLGEEGLTVSRESIDKGLSTVSLAGRFQVIPGRYEQILDVTHNEQGAMNLASMLDEIPCKGRTLAVLAMLQDKDPGAVVRVLQDKVDTWFLASLGGTRGMSVERLAHILSSEFADMEMKHFQTVKEAYVDASTVAKEGDRIVIFGSFHTVEEVMRLL
jgi:dihydrofolate synthase/folylpolyglutamate synthase